MSDRLRVRVTFLRRQGKRRRNRLKNHKRLLWENRVRLCFSQVVFLIQSLIKRIMSMMNLKHRLSTLQFLYPQYLTLCKIRSKLCSKTNLRTSSSMITLTTNYNLPFSQRRLLWPKSTYRGHRLRYWSCLMLRSTREVGQPRRKERRRMMVKSRRVNLLDRCLLSTSCHSRLLLLTMISVHVGHSNSDKSKFQMMRNVDPTLNPGLLRLFWRKKWSKRVSGNPETRI